MNDKPKGKSKDKPKAGVNGKAGAKGNGSRDKSDKDAIAAKDPKVIAKDKDPLHNQQGPAKNQFGTFNGVFVPSILTILGVILFLRMGWVVGNVGLIGSILIITISSVITLITGLSISASATNMQVGVGGSYFMVSRSFGVEAGAAIGLPLYCAQALGISFYLVGFAESLTMFFPDIPITWVAGTTLFLLTALTFVSSSLALKMQMFIFAVIIFSIGSFFLGGGYDGLPPETVAQKTEFWKVFAVFFPAVTGIEAGISMSGDLKNPGRSLPIGTIAAVITGYVVYLSAAVFLYFKADEQLLLQENLLMIKIAAIPALIYAGLWCATLSSGLGALLGAPRTLQAMARDRILPKFLGRSSGKYKEPRVATVVSCLIALGGIFLGDLNAIAPVLSMFFLTSYASLNLISGVEGMIANPSWRPSFNTPWMLSLWGALLCIAAMMMIDAGASFVAIFLIIGVYWLMRRRKLDANYTDIRQSLFSYFARSSIYRLSTYSTDARNWMPNFLVLSGKPKSRLYLLKFAKSVVENRGIITVASVITQPDIEQSKIPSFERSTAEFLRKKKVEALVKVTKAPDFQTGAEALIHNYGIGTIVPNTLLMGVSSQSDVFPEFCEIVCRAYREHKNVICIKHPKDDPEAFFDGVKNIDIWWRGKHNNASLMLALAHMISPTFEKAGAEMYIKSFAENEDERRGIIKSLEELTKEGRLDAKFDIYVGADDGRALERMKKYSSTDDLIFLGLRPPEKNETGMEYADYYEALLERTESYKNIVFTLAGENIAFHEIFD